MWSLRCLADWISHSLTIFSGLQVVGSLGIPPNHPNILNWVGSVCALVLLLELNALGLLGNFSIRLDLEETSSPEGDIGAVLDSGVVYHQRTFNRLRRIMAAAGKCIV
jgi:hypothetical protein